MSERVWVCQNMTCLKRTGNSKEFRVCSSCRSASYCSRECQKAHWKIHKPGCSATTEAHALVSSGMSGTNLSQPGISAPKLAKDLEKWTNAHSQWLYLCFISQIHNFNDSPDRWKTHGVKVEVVPHNTRQSVYRFTFQSRSLMSYQRVRENMKGSHSEAGLLKAFNMVRPTEGPNGKMLGCGILLLVSQTTLRPIPFSFDLGVSYPIPLDYSPDQDMLKAPEGTNTNIYNALIDWWDKQSAAIVFCCVNMFNLKPGSPLIYETIQFDTMYRVKGKKIQFSPLKPAKQSWSWLEDQHSQIDSDAKCSRLNTYRLRRVSTGGEPGMIIVATITLLGLIICQTHFICDSELAHIERRDDWEHHFYTLLVNYDLKY